MGMGGLGYNEVQSQGAEWMGTGVLGYNEVQSHIYIYMMKC